MTKDIISNNDSKIRLCKMAIYAYNFHFEGIKFMNNQTEHISGASLDTKKDTNRAEGLFHGYHESELHCILIDLDPALNGCNFQNVRHDRELSKQYE